MATKPPLPPFTLETARVKVKAAQDAWNTKSVPLPSLAMCLWIKKRLGTHKSSREPIPLTQFGETEISSFEAQMRS
jgi:nuclear transport factor 2 (NTF2) superfamily protein